MKIVLERGEPNYIIDSKELPKESQLNALVSSKCLWWSVVGVKHAWIELYTVR